MYVCKFVYSMAVGAGLVSLAMAGPVIGDFSVKGHQTVYLGMRSNLNVCWLEKQFLALSFLYLAKASALCAGGGTSPLPHPPRMATYAPFSHNFKLLAGPL